MIGPQAVVQLDLIQSERVLDGGLQVAAQGCQPARSLDTKLHLRLMLLLDGFQQGVQLTPILGHGVPQTRQFRAFGLGVSDQRIQGTRHLEVPFAKPLGSLQGDPVACQDSLDPIRDGPIPGQPALPVPPAKPGHEQGRGCHEEEGRLKGREGPGVTEEQVGHGPKQGQSHDFHRELLPRPLFPDGPDPSNAHFLSHGGSIGSSAMEGKNQTVRQRTS